MTRRTMRGAMHKRLDRVRLWMEEKNIDAVLISNAQNIYYLSGFSGGEDGLLLIDRQCHYVLTDSRYHEQCRLECPGAVIWDNRKGNLFDALAEHSGKYRRIAAETHHISHDSFTRLQVVLGGELLSLQEYIESLRRIKDDNELERLRTSGRIGDQALDRVVKGLRTETTEREIAANLALQMKKLGCSGESFDTIVLFGPGAALPHGRPGDSQPVPGGPALFDFGGYFQHYTADMSRTFAFRKADPIFRDRYQAVLEAQQAGLEQVKAGVHARQIHLAVVRTLARYGLDQYFVHSTGHGIGLDIHEQPRISDKSTDILERGMVVTIEPGVYLPGWGGIRIEDSVIVEDRGCERITLSGKELVIITEG